MRLIATFIASRGMREMRAHASVLQRDVLDAVGAKQRQLADVAIVARLVPGIVGVRVLPVAELMSAYRVSRRRHDSKAWRGCREALRRTVRATSAAHGATGPHRRARRARRSRAPIRPRGPRPRHRHPEALGARRRTAVRRQRRRAAPGSGAPAPRPDATTMVTGAVGPRGDDRRLHAEAGSKLFLQHEGRRRSGGRLLPWRNDDGGVREIDQVGRGGAGRRERQHGQQPGPGRTAKRRWRTGASYLSRSSSSVA